MSTNCQRKAIRKQSKFWVWQWRSLTSQMQLSILWVFACSKPSWVALPTKVTNCQSGARACFAKQNPECLPDQHLSNVQILSNNDLQTLVSRLIPPWSYWHFQLHCESEVWMNTSDALNILKIKFVNDEDVSALFTIRRDSKKDFHELTACSRMTAIYILLHWWGDSTVFVSCYNCCKVFFKQQGWWPFPLQDAKSGYIQE